MAKNALTVEINKIKADTRKKTISAAGSCFLNSVSGASATGIASEFFNSAYSHYADNKEAQIKMMDMSSEEKEQKLDALEKKKSIVKFASKAIKIIGAAAAVTFSVINCRTTVDLVKKDEKREIAKTINSHKKNSQ